MSISPDVERFSEIYTQGLPQVVWATMVADLETPVSSLLKLCGEQRNTFLLESVEGGDTRGRYSFIGFAPDLIWRCRGDQAEINRHALQNDQVFEACPEGSLESLRGLVAESLIELPEELPPMSAGLVGYLGYDMVRLMERLPERNPDPLNLPDGMFVRPTVMAVFDTVMDMISVVTPVRPERGMSAEAAYARANDRLNSAIDAFDAPLIHKDRQLADIEGFPEAQSNTTHAEYHEMVKRAKEYIMAGDVFQVVPSQRFRIPFELPALALYRALRRTNPSPYMYYLNFDDFCVVGSSPEIMVKVKKDGTVVIRPIAGTRPRGATASEDKALEEDLLSDPKELAEHLMLLDLGRNDTGRVSKPGTVHVTDQFFVERYSHVMHMVSNVEGQISPEFDAISAMVAGFPPGTVSGAPKIRAMEIIDELEKEKRGIYAGAVGYFAADGSMDTCIVLRTAIVKDGMMYVQAGGGVVADSDPEAEFQETVSKAKALMQAAEEAIRYDAAATRGQ